MFGGASDLAMLKDIWDRVLVIGYIIERVHNFLFRMGFKFIHQDRSS
jgi:hypothetical protein